MQAPLAAPDTGGLSTFQMTIADRSRDAGGCYTLKSPSQALFDMVATLEVER